MFLPVVKGKCSSRQKVVNIISAVIVNPRRRLRQFLQRCQTTIMFCQFHFIIVPILSNRYLYPLTFAFPKWAIVNFSKMHKLFMFPCLLHLCIFLLFFWQQKLNLSYFLLLANATTPFLDLEFQLNLNPS